LPSTRRSVLDLAPLELDCMNMLWPIGEGTVREIRDRLAERRPRAYTTIMTIMDRLAKKGVVERRKVGRAYMYRANLTMEDARAQALRQVVENFFGGSPEALVAQMNGSMSSRPAEPGSAILPRALAAAAGAASQSPAMSARTGGGPRADVPATAATRGPAAETQRDRTAEDERIDDTLL
jgi:predicted transcriptional regulator